MQEKGGEGGDGGNGDRDGKEEEEEESIPDTETRNSLVKFFFNIFVFLFVWDRLGAYDSCHSPQNSNIAHNFDDMFYIF